MSDIDWQGRYEDARDDLKAMQARAEQAEADLAQTERERKELVGVSIRADAKVAALEARLAEVGPVVEAAEWLVDADDAFTAPTGGASEHADWVKAFAAVDKTVRALRAARSLRGAGDATRPMATDMIGCPRCGRNHAAYIQGCAVEGRSDATGNGWDARGAGEGGGA